MKKKYKAPQIENVIFSSASSILEGSRDPFIEGTGEGGINIGGGGQGDQGDEVESKRTGRFWDDEY